MMIDIFGKKKVAKLEAELRNAAHTLQARDLLSGALGMSHGGKRDTYEVYGYPQRTTFSQMYRYARREGISNRVVFGVPKSCWRDGYYVCTENEDGETLHIEDEINQLNNGDDEFPGFLSFIERADALNRIGKFSVLYIGVPDGLEPTEPLGRAMGDSLSEIYFRAFAYDGVQVSRYDMDTESKRYGMPDLYQLQVIGRGDTEKDQNTETMVVHYSRIIHLVESPLDSTLEGIPALEPVFNDCLNIDKTLGGASEAYFRNARGKIAFEVDKDFGTALIDNPEARASFDEAGKAFTNNWQDQIVAIGSKVAALTTPHASPMDTYKASLMRVQAQTGIPSRILTGEGGGQLAGSQDKVSYGVLIEDRRNSFCMNVVRQVLNKLDYAGVITLPENYIVRFNRQDATSEMEAAEIGAKRASSLQQLASARSTIAGSEIDMRTALDACYLQDVEIDELELDINQVPVVEGVEPGVEDEASNENPTN